MELLSQGQEEILEAVSVPFTIRYTTNENNMISFTEREEREITMLETSSQIVHLDQRALRESRESPMFNHEQLQTEDIQEETQVTELHASSSQTANRVEKSTTARSGAIKARLCSCKIQEMSLSY
ncbi:uncharacterized protein LOC105186261 [Harpegnathos saltator]|uniref:uncharacterized protein LOC105186261 n=1 Tax=Harpegnathos saltator TaxID=610380 RepID=UPI00058CDAA8|nr:uncharacterized protein LOC105186261 [Harpegnathos saltator]